jgi:hypothetical protein
VAVFAVAGLFLFSSSAQAATYYIDNTCADTNVASATVDGTVYNPATLACTGGSDKYFATIADINAAAATLNPGDTISFRKGLTWNERLTIPESGTAGNVYTYNSFGTGNRPIIDAQNTRVRCILANTPNIDYVTISGIACQNATGAGFEFSSGANITNITIDDCYFNETGGAGVYFSLTPTATATNVTISNSTFNQWAQTVVDSDAIWLESGIFNTAIIRGNYIDINGSSVTASDGIYINKPVNSLIENNEIASGNAHGIITGYDGSGTIIRYNYIHDLKDDCLWIMSNTIAGGIIGYENICKGIGDDCWDIDGGGAGLTGRGEIYNSTCIYPDSSCYDLEGNGVSVGIFKNNICIFETAATYYNLDPNYTDEICRPEAWPGVNCVAGHYFVSLEGGSSISSHVFSNNIYYDETGTYGDTFIFPNSSTYTFAEWQADSSAPDQNSVATNPLLVSSSNFNLQSTSPAIDAGIDLNLATDYSSNSRYDMPSITNTGSAGSYAINYTDIGAYEYITPPDPVLNSSTHPSESTWYNSISPVTMIFDAFYDTILRATTTDFKYLIDQTESPTLNTVKTTGTLLNDAVTFNAGGSITSDGTWYIHAIAQNEATTTVYSSNYDTYTIKYDATAPSISLSSPANNNQSSNQPTFAWSGSDSSSGIANYQLYIDSTLNTDNITGVSSAPSSTLSCGAHTWYVKAIDNAGNSANSSTYNLAVACGSTPLWLLQQINQQPTLTETNTGDTTTPTPTTGGTTNNAPITIEQMLTEAKIVNLADVNNIAAEAGATRDIKVETNYDKTLITKISSTAELAALTKEDRASLSGFISYGTASTKNLGASERVGVVNSFKAAFGRLPTKEADWSDVIKIANGRWPTQRSKTAEDRANINFKSIYKRQPNRKNTHDDAAITVMAYGLRPAKRNLGSEKAAIKSFKAIYGYNPVKATAWDAVRAIAYSGAKR